MVEDIEYRTKYYDCYKKDNALHYLRLANLNGSTKQKLIDFKTYLTEHYSNASCFKLWHDYDVHSQYGPLNKLIRFIFDKILKASIVYLDDTCMAFEEVYDENTDEYVMICDQELFNDFSQENDYWTLCQQLDYIIETIDDNIVMPEINYKIVYIFYNYEMFDFGAYEGEFAKL